MSDALVAEPRVIAIDVGRYFNSFITQYVQKGDRIGVKDLQALIREVLTDPDSDNIADYITSCAYDDERVAILLYKFLTEYITEITGLLCGPNDDPVECLSVVFDRDSLMTVVVVRYHR